MSHELPELPEMQRSLGRRLASSRKLLGIGQQRLARHTGYSRSSISHAEAGRQLLTPAFWSAADALVKADGVLLSEYTRLLAIRSEYDRLHREAEVARAYTEVQVWRTERLLGRELSDDLGQAVTSASTKLLDQLRDPLTKFLHEWADDMNRRDLLRLLGWTATGTASMTAVAGSLNPDESARVMHAIASPNRVDTAVIRHLDSVHRLLQQQDDVLGAQSVLDAALTQRSVVTSLLSDCPTALRSSLLATSGRMSCSIGNYFIDLDDIPNARENLVQARTEAQAANDTNLGVYSLCLESKAAFLQDDNRSGVALAEAATNLAPRITDSRVQAQSYETSARAHSQNFDRYLCLSELDKAHSTLTTPSEPNSPAYYYDESYLLRHESRYMTQLGRYDDAVNSAQDAVNLCDPAKPDVYAYTLLALTDAHLSAHHPDTAAHHLTHAATHAAHNRTPGLLTALRNTRHHLTPWNNTTAVTQLDEHLTKLGMQV